MYPYFKYSITIDYSKIVKKIRETKRISQLNLELNMGLSLGTISRIENGKVNPTKETLFKIAQGLNLNLQERVELFGLNTLESN